MKRLDSYEAKPSAVEIDWIEKEAESEAIFKSIGDGAMATDAYGHITRINPAALKILGLKPEEAIGQWFPHILSPVRLDNTALPLMERPIFKMFLTGKPITEKLLYRNKRGLIIPVSTTVSPIMLAGRPVGAIEVFRDITFENEVDKMKSEFISLASHQLRTPLSTVKTYSHMLSEGYMGKVTKEQAQALKTITNATNNMNELISTLLNIARIESGSMKVSRKSNDLKTLASEVIKQTEIPAKQKSINLTFHAPEQPVVIKTDGLIVREILSNLISNAIKYSPNKRDVSVTIRNRRDQVLFTVQDKGLGIPSQAQDKIFSKFFRANNVVQREATGTGLGLYVVKGLVTLLNGKVSFKSTEHTGSTFYVYLPKNTKKKPS
ncbi:MAG: ATP-binding protein [Candidatus Saccharimonadales bacterium]